MIFAFFPCIRFEEQILLHFRGDVFGMNKWDIERKIENCIKLHSELHELYTLISKLVIVCNKRKLRLIIENPYSQNHYLKKYWCVKPSVIHDDRRERGDYFKKPTQFWFINCEPENNFIFEVANDNAIKCKDAIRTMKKSDYIKTGAKNKKVARPMIHKDYAMRFIKEYII